MVRVLGLLPYPVARAPGQRYRIEQWAPLMAREGVDLSFSPFLSCEGFDVLYRHGATARKVGATLAGYWRRLRELLSPLRFDVAFVYREAALLGPAWIESLLAKRLPLVFDFDDAIFLPASSPANAWASRLKRGEKAEAICRLARHVTVGNEFLAGFARPRSRAVSVIPSTIDTVAYDPQPRAPNPRPVVGWTGSPTTLPYLGNLAPALRRLRSHMDFELHVIGGHLEIAGLEVRCTAWRPEKEVDDLRRFDVGLMPLSDDAWSRGKCGLKALQYMALAVPPVVSPVGVNVAIVSDGVNGFHARDEDEWVDRIRRLLEDPILRTRLGAEARRTVETGFSARVHAPRMAQVLRQVAGAG